MDRTELKTKAQDGDRAAQYALGLSYSNRTGKHRDYVEAYKWLSLSGATSAANMISHFMTPEQLKEAQRRISLYFPEEVPPFPSDEA